MKKSGIADQTVRVFESEKSLVLGFIDEMEKVDPDVLVSFE